MFRIVIISSCLFFVQIACGQNFCSSGARSGSLANSSVALCDGWSYFYNPGALGYLKKAEVGMGYENRFLLKELQVQSIFYAQPLKKGVVSLGAIFYGWEIYRSSRVGFGYSLQLLENLFAGIQLNYQSIQFSSNYDESRTLTAEGGLYIKMNEKWKLGISVFNIGRAKFSRDFDERISTVMKIGSHYQLSEIVGITMEAEKNVNYLLRLKSGVEYNPLKRMFFRIGIATQPMEYSFGFGYRFPHIQLDFGSAYHQLLGWTPQFSLSYKFESIN